MEDTKHPPNDRGQGRKPISKTGELMKSRPIRMTDDEWAKCKLLGGAVWVRDRIKSAKLPEVTSASTATAGTKKRGSGKSTQT